MGWGSRVRSAKDRCPLRVFGRRCGIFRFGRGGWGLWGGGGGERGAGFGCGRGGGGN